MATLRRFSTLVLTLSFGLTVAFGAQAPCAVRVKTDVTVEAEELMLSDLLGADSCGDVLRAAHRVAIGKAPRAGSPRVLEGVEVRGRIERVVASGFSGDSHALIVGAWIVPERIVVRRGGGALSCIAIASRFFSLAGQGKAFDRVECGAEGRIRGDAPLEVTRRRWDRSLQRWEFITACVEPRDCVPFWMTGANLPGVVHPLTAETPPSGPSPLSARKVLVRAGQKASLLWDSAGIRTVVPVVCLEDGRQGESVRTRLLRSGRVLRARVMAPGSVRADR